ncbi:hypothetical protein HCG51_10875 [Tolypothrix sp. PCC 7910]|uniref:hypothetical protein n=1 Tax=Tolypothrix sp. PCC 7910 TaxID=2099387 RepID=UPI0014277955|nr:hypothetical protein [Tolypothrix sp. PCC 7910]QIR37175.1 hypothetical protein HCG51_10875 [Tolypothrix sp. PCC 7910]
MYNVFSTAELQQELEQNGYVVIDFLIESEVQTLLNFYQRNSLPEDLVKHSVSFSILSSDTSYRQLVSCEIKNLFAPKLITIFSEYRGLLYNFATKKRSV